VNIQVYLFILVVKIGLNFIFIIVQLQEKAKQLKKTITKNMVSILHLLIK